MIKTNTDDIAGWQLWSARNPGQVYDAAMTKLFPKPAEASDKNSAVWRSPEDLLDLANKMNGWEYKNFTATVKDWIRGHAISIGWREVHFPLAYPNKTLYAGGVFLK